MPVDIALDASDDFPHYVGGLVGGDDLVVQRARIRVRTFRGDYLLDASAGLPYVEWGGRKTDLAGVVLAIRRELEAIPGVKRADLVGTLDATTRRARVSGRVFFDDGESVGINVAPFGVDGRPVPSVVATP